VTKDHDDLIRRHYRAQAERDGDSSLSTIGERVIREKEIDLIRSFLRAVRRKKPSDDLTILDAGCGNGYTLALLVEDHPGCEFHGLEFTEEMLAIARRRELPRCVLDRGDIRSTSYPSQCFDVVYTERCLINILDWGEQKQALDEIARILKPSGHYLMIEGFTDGLENNNRARREMGLDDIESAYHNRYLEKEELFEAVQPTLRVVDPAELGPEGGGDLLRSNFLSSHYFVARILHPLITRGEWVRNTEFVKFFSFLPPVGNYAPVQAYIFEKL
jgi:ubiquinone/menaquinone biosynthesis C-methylase UbiE